MDIRPEWIYERYQQIAAEDRRRYVDPGTGAVFDDCGVPSPACVACAGELQAEPGLSGYRVCQSCRSLISDPMLSPTSMADSWRSAGAANYFHQHIYAPTAERRRGLMVERCAMLGAYVRHGRVLELGCGIGLFLDALREAGYAGEGVEVLPYPIEQCHAKGHVIHAQPIQQLSPAEGAYDAIVGWEVIAHFYDLPAVMRQLVAALRPGGYLMLTTPNASGLEYDRIWSDGRRRHDNLDPSVFLQILSLQGLRMLAEGSGLSVVELSTPGRMDLQNIQRHAKSSGRTFALRMLNDLLLNESSDSAVSGLQHWLADSGYSGHCRLVARKPKLEVDRAIS